MKSARSGFIHKIALFGLALAIIICATVIVNRDIFFSPKIEKLSGEVAGALAGSPSKLLSVSTISAAPYSNVEGDVAVSGNVSLGTAASPKQIQQDSNNFYLPQASGWARFTSAGGYAFWLDSNNDATNSVFSIRKDSASFNGSDAEIFRVQENGNVGITNSTAAVSGGLSTPGSLNFGSFGWNAYTGSVPINGQVLFSGTYSSSTGSVEPYLTFSLQGTGNTAGHGLAAAGPNTLTERMRITNAGNIGIGTATPGDLLTVGNSYTSTNRNVIRSQGGWADPATPGSDSNGDRLLLYKTTGYTTGIGFGAQNDMWFQAHGTSGQPAFRWFTGIGSGSAPTEKMRITTDGRVGIGTGATALTQTLQVEGTIGLSTAGFFANNNSGLATNFSGFYQQYGTTAQGFAYNLRSASDTENPIYKILDGRINTSAFSVNSRTGDVALLNGKHALRSNDAWLRLNQDGAFTSGTHTPGLFAPGSLNVGGYNGYGNPGSGNAWVNGTLGVGTNVDWEAPVTLKNANNAARWYLGPSNSGGFVIYRNNGTATNGMYLTSENPTSWASNSDQRLKTNIQNLANDQGLVSILKLNPVSFSWLNAESSKTNQLGFIAQEVQKIFPELVSQGPDSTITNSDGSTQTISKPLGLNLTGFIPSIVKAIQELNQSSSDLKEQVKLQQQQIEKLQQEVNELKLQVNNH